MFNNNYGTTVFFLILKEKFGHTQLQKKEMKMKEKKKKFKRRKNQKTKQEKQQTQ